MGNCIDPECHNIVQGHTVTLFGKDGLHGIAGAKGGLNELKDLILDVASCAKRKTSNVRFYLTIGSVFVATIIIITPFLLMAIEAWSTEKQLNHDNRAAIVSQKEFNQSIKGDINKIRSDIKELKDARVNLLKMIKKTVKTAVIEAHEEASEKKGNLNGKSRYQNFE